MANHKLFTIGYEGTNQEDFLTTLKTKEVACVIDIRDVPISRRKGFSKNSLSEALESCGIKYVHLKGLGDPKAGREAARAGRFDEFREIYQRHLETSQAVHDLDMAVSMAIGVSCCLLCYERNYEHCHRSIVAAKLRERESFVVKNIGVMDRDGNKRWKIRAREGSDTSQGLAAYS